MTSKGGTRVPKKIVEGVDPKDSLKVEKSEAITAMRQLLCAQSESVRNNFQNRIMDAKNSAQISIILREVRDLI